MRDGFTLMEALIALIVASISVVIIIGAARMYIDNRNLSIIYKNAYDKIFNAYEAAKQILFNGDTTIDVDVVSEGNFKGCEVLRITFESSQVRSIVSGKTLQIPLGDRSFTVLNCH